MKFNLKKESSLHLQPSYKSRSSLQSYCTEKLKALQMGIANTRDFFAGRRLVDEATSNSSLSKLRYVSYDRPKWKVFTKREIRAVPNVYQATRGQRGCPCGSNGPCRQKVTPKGVTMHYPEKYRKKIGLGVRNTKPKIQAGYLTRRVRRFRATEVNSKKLKLLRSKIMRRITKKKQMIQEEYSDDGDMPPFQQIFFT